MTTGEPEKHLYRPAWWVPGGHLKTIWGRVLRRTRDVQTVPLCWETPDGDFLELLRVEGKPGRPRLLILHGLEGSPRSHYARALLHEGQQRGWGTDLLIFRSCGSKMNRGRRFYHSGETGDLDFVVRRVLAEFPGAPLVLAGVSLGGNVLLKWLGENGNRLPDSIRAAVAISVPFDLARSSRQLGRGISRIYERVFLRTLLRKAAGLRQRFPDLLPGVDLDGISTLWEFDDLVTAPIHGFSSADDYYSRSSSLVWIDKIRIPTLLLSAVDDPFLPSSVLADVRGIADRNGSLEIEFVEKGGHVGFISGRNPVRPFYYSEWRACEFLSDHVG